MNVKFKLIGLIVTIIFETLKMSFYITTIIVLIRAMLLLSVNVKRVFVCLCFVCFLFLCLSGFNHTCLNMNYSRLGNINTVIFV